MTEYKEVIFEWVDSGGEYHYERRIVRNNGMTKRFSYIKNNSISQYSVLPIQEIGGKTYHCQGIVDKLNKLSEENEQLKQQLKSIDDNLIEKCFNYIKPRCPYCNTDVTYVYYGNNGERYCPNCIKELKDGDIE